MTLSPGDICYVLSGYDLERCEVIAVGRARLKVRLSRRPEYVFFTKPEKVACPDELVVVVWEKGRSPRGSYRIERELYTQQRQPACTVTRQPSSLPGSGHITEEKC
jgi:hypothetical protein